MNRGSHHPHLPAYMATVNQQNRQLGGGNIRMTFPENNRSQMSGFQQKQQPQPPQLPNFQPPPQQQQQQRLQPQQQQQPRQDPRGSAAAPRNYR